jgi:hypothetical protein
MPVYQYEGVHYSLPDGLSDEEAIGKIKAHLGKGGASPSGPSIVDRATDALKGTAEAGLNLAGGIGSMFVAPVGAGLSALNDLGSGKEPHFLKDYETIMGKGGSLGTQLADATGMRSETGDTLNENIGQFINQVGIPGGLGASTLGFGPRVAPSPRVPMAREPILSPVDKAIAEAQAKKNVPQTKPVEVPEGVRAQQELFNREEFKPEVPKTDTTPQMELPFAAGPEEILREQYKNAPERDMFVEQDIADRAKDPVREQMAAETQKAAEVDQAYAQRAQQENLAARVEELKQKLEAPRRGPRGQSGAIDMEIVKGLTDSFNIKKILHDIDLITSSKNIDNIYTYIEKNKNKNSLEALFNRIDNENTIKTLNKNQYIKPPGTRMIGGGKIKRNSGRYGRQRGAIDVEAVKELGALFKQGAATAMDVLRSFKGAFTENEHGLAMKSVTNPKSLDTVTLMTPEQFHQLASGRTPAELNASYTPRLYESIREGLKSKGGLWKMPYLRVDDSGQVTAHEGRHRMDVFKEQGIELVPVRLRKEAGAGWGEAERPNVIIPQDFRNSPGSVKAVAALPFPETLHQPKAVQLPKSQRGAIDLGKPSPDKAKVVDDILGTKLYQEATDPKSVIKDALAEGKDGSGSILLSAGGTLEGAKRNSALIKGGVRIVQRLKNIAEDKIRTSVFPVEKRLRKLSSTELQDLSKVMKSEMFDGTPVPMERLAEIFSEKQLAAYSEMRRMFKDALDTQNEARAKQGLDPITAQEAYLSSRWRGDFRRAIYNKEGKLVWYLAAETKKGLDTQAQALVKKFPDLAGGDHVDHVTRSVGRDNLQSLYSTMLDVLGRDDPKVEQVRQWVEDQTRMEAEGALAQTKHFEKKGNVRGFIGDRPSNTMFGKLDPKKEALAMFQEQINYAKNAHKWAGLQEAGAQLKEIFSNEDLQTQQPKNMQYLREYYLDQVGMGTAKVVRHLEDAFKETGISPKAVEGGINSIKSLWISQKLVASAGFMLSNVIQAGNMIPHLIDLQRTYKGNPLALPAALISGFAEGMLMATGHLTGTAKEMINSAKYRPGDSVFSAKAMKYAEDNSVIARSIYDEAPIESSFSNTGRIANGLGKTISMPEAFLRSVVYMTYVNMLKYGGKLTNDMEIFRIAEEKTNISMGDYRTGERALIFSKLGTTGSALNLLQTYPMNYYNQWSWAARETMRGNAAPAAAMFAVQATAAGVMGIPGFQDTDKLWNAIKNTLADHSPKAWNAVKDIDLKSFVLNNFGEAGLYGAVSKASGVSVTSRAAAPAGSEMLANPLAPAVDLAKQTGNIVSAIASPSDPQKAAQAMLGSAPVGLQGYLETGPLKNQTSVERNGQRVYGKTTDLSAREGQYSRSPEEERLRSFGLRSQKETFEKDLAYRTRSKDVQAATVASKLPDRVYNEVRKGNIDEAKVYIRMYAEITGKPMTEDMFQSRIMDEYTTSAEKATMKAKTLPGIAALKNLRDLLKEQNANQ